ncbi:MAG: hypothetical protein HFI93_03485 [Lachnospiraceae bacterium]|nr:hypothetical protein [Lachnospiraceae bacterium]
MKKKLTRWFSFFAICLLLLGSMGSVYAAEETLTVELDVTYGQTEAREMLRGINEFRTGSEAWYTDPSGAKVPVTRGELVYDYALEQIAMQRAAEIALSYAHERPDGTVCFTCEYEGVTTNGENILAGVGVSASMALEEWKETAEDFSGQGHRRIMLGVDDDGSEFPVAAVGIGHVTVNGIDYWVQEFGVTAPAPLRLEAGASVDAPSVKAAVPPVIGGWEPARNITAALNWTAADPSIVSVSNGKITGIRAGKTSLTAKLGDQTVELSVEVTPVSLQTADITLNPESAVYNGTDIEPEVTVRMGSVLLVKGTDYTVSYADNREVGTGRVIVTGMGSYTGRVEKTFEISSCNHQWKEQEDQRVEATCKEEGKKIYSCMVCGDSKTEPIEKLPHTPKEVGVLQPTCTEDGHTAGSVCAVCQELLENTEVLPALGHKWDEGTVLKEATYAEEGSIRYVCGVCKEEKTEMIPRLEYKITQGAGQTLLQEADGRKGLTITCDGPLEKMVSLEIDGKPVDPKYYEAVSGSTIVTIKPEYLATLSVGAHTWRLNYVDGSVETTFILKKAEEGDDGRRRKSGDDRPESAYDRRFLRK